MNAGAGILNVQVDGPSKVTLDAYELELGYKVRFTPLAPGDYFAAVKYNGLSTVVHLCLRHFLGIHIPGSPFKIPVSGKELGGNGYNETSFVKIDAAAKTSRGTVATVPEYKGDATKVSNCYVFHSTLASFLSFLFRSLLKVPDSTSSSLVDLLFSQSTLV